MELDLLLVNEDGGTFMSDAAKLYGILFQCVFGRI